MKWQGREESQNVQDRRSFGKKAGMAVGGGGIIVLILALLMGVDPQQLFNQVQEGQQVEQRFDPAEEKLASFTKVVLRDTEVVWEELFLKMGRRYEKPTLVLFRDQVESACGFADAAVGPFYCPRDSMIYIDMTFYKDMQRKLNAPGEFARAYVIAHEVGHHVQRLLGYSQRVDESRSGPRAEFNRMSVRLELQADYLAGVWAHHGQRRFNFLESGDIDSALNAAFEIGDDRLQRKAQGYVVPDTFTHGTSKQRVRWFQEGFRGGDVRGAKELFDLPYSQL